MGFNKGEWSELYAFLYLIDNPNLVVVDENLQQKNSTTFRILEILLENESRYKLLDNNKLIKILPNRATKEYDINYIGSQHKLLLEKIMAHKSAKGTFEIREIEPLINDLLDGNKLKGRSTVKGDVNAIVFGMRASEVWNGVNEVNGGIIIVTKTGEVYLLDLIYFKNIVDKYLIDNIKLESPSSSRYKMFEIYKENGKYYFKLNLQVRFK